MVKWTILLLLIQILCSGCQVERKFKIIQQGHFAIQREKNEYISDHFLFDYNQDSYQDLIAITLKDPPSIPAQLGRVLFIKNIDGEKLEVDQSQEFTSTHPRWTTDVDWNGDGRNDLFIADHGTDVAPHPGATNFVLLSDKQQVKKIDLPGKGFSFSVTSGTISKEFPSVFFVANLNHFKKTGFYIKKDDSLSLLGARGLGADVIDKQLFMTAKLYDFNGDGWDDLFLGGMNGRGIQGDRIYFNDGKGYFHHWIELPKRYRYPSWGSVAVTIKKRDNNSFLLLTSVHNNAITKGAIQVIELVKDQDQWKSKTIQVITPFVQGSFWIPWMSLDNQHKKEKFKLTFSLRRGVGEPFLGERFGLYSWNKDHFHDISSSLKKILPSHYWSSVFFKDMDNDGIEELVFIGMEQHYFYIHELEMRGK